MTLQELGQSIHDKREAVGMTLDDVSARIKVSSRILKSIEEGSLVGLPHAVYIKSFIRAFGLQIGYDPQELNAALEEIFPQDSLAGIYELTFKNQAAMLYPGGTGKRFAASVAGFLVLGGLVGGGWYVATTYGDQILELVKKPFSAITVLTERDGSAQNADSTPAAGNRAILQTLQALSGPEPASSGTGYSSVPGRGAPAQSAAPATGSLSSPVAHSPAPARVAASGTGDAAVPPDAIPSRQGDTGAERTAGRESEVAATQDSGGSATAGESADDGAPPATSSVLPAASGNGQPGTTDSSNRLVILADEACWIDSKADGVLGRDYTLRPGERFVLTYVRSLEVTLGNAGGVELEHNGRKLGKPGQRGRKVMLRFPEAGR